MPCLEGLGVTKDGLGVALPDGLAVTKDGLGVPEGLGVAKDGLGVPSEEGLGVPRDGLGVPSLEGLGVTEDGLGVGLSVGTQLQYAVSLTLSTPALCDAMAMLVKALKTTLMLSLSENTFSGMVISTANILSFTSP